MVSNILTQVFITLIAVAGVYVLTGLTGLFSLGQAAFMAIGSYASGLLVVKAHTVSYTPLSGVRRLGAVPPAALPAVQPVPGKCRAGAGLSLIHILNARNSSLVAAKQDNRPNVRRMAIKSRFSFPAN